MLKKRKTIPLKLRLKIANKFNCTCQKCGKVGILDQVHGRVLDSQKRFIDFDGKYFVYISFEFDHIIPLVKGGPDIEENLQLVCRSCNRKKASKNG